MYGYANGYMINPNKGSLGSLPRCLYTMDGVDELINMGDVAAFELDTFTITAKIKKAANGVRYVLFGNQLQSAAAGGLSGVFAEFFSNNKIVVYFVISNTYESVTTTLAYTSTSNEYDVAIKKSGTSVTIYVDGVSAGTGTLSSSTIDYSTTSSKRTTIGAAWDGNGSSYILPLNGTVRDVRLYNVALSEADVNLVKNWSYAPSGMVANWIGENATDTFSTNWTVVDSVSANNGTSVNMEEGDRTC